MSVLCISYIASFNENMAIFSPAGRVKAFVADITRPDDLLANIPPGSVDFVSMVFVLSAISPDMMHAAISNVARLLKPGTGKLLFRDYGRGDMAQDKHQVCPPLCSQSIPAFL